MQSAKKSFGIAGFQWRFRWSKAYCIPCLGIVIFAPKNRIILPEENGANPYRPNQRDYFKGFDSILTLSIPGVLPMDAQKPILTLVPEGTISTLTE